MLRGSFMVGNTKEVNYDQVGKGCKSAFRSLNDIKPFKTNVQSVRSSDINVTYSTAG